MPYRALAACSSDAGDRVQSYAHARPFFMLWLCQVLWGAGQSHVAGEEEGHQQALEEWGQGQGLAAEGPEVQE